MTTKEQLQQAFARAQQLQQAGRFAEAERAWLDLGKTLPNHAGLLANLAATQWQLGKQADAETTAGRAVQAAPNLAQAWAIFAAGAEVRGAVEEAIQRYRRALELKPEMANALNGLANLYRKHGDFGQARDYAERLATLQPDSGPAHDLMGAILLAMGELDAAETALQRAAGLAPDLVSARSNLGAVYAERRQWAEALAHYDAALALNDFLAETHNNRGNALMSLGCVDEAETAFARALELAPDDPEARFNQSLLWLKQGRWRDAWPGFEQRWQTRQMAPFRRAFDVPAWDGAMAPDKTLLVHAEQGMGDMMMVARYLPLAAERVGRVVVECQPALASLLATDHEVVAAGDPLPSFDLHLPAMSLPGVFESTPETVPWNGPYLAQSNGPSSSGETLNVGLVWAGNPKNPTDGERSAPLAALAPILDVPGCRIHSLQHGPPGDQIAAAEFAGRLIDHRADLTDFAATANLVSGLDLVISICTSVAHLAGAMGVPLWVMLAADADWRWLMDRDDSPWYPSAKLYRQPSPRDWKALADHVAAALRQHVAGEISG